MPGIQATRGMDPGKGGPYGGGFSGYTPFPLTTGIALSVSGEQVCTTGANTLYRGTGLKVLGAILNNNAADYSVFSWASASTFWQGGDPTTNGNEQYFEGSGASTSAGTGTGSAPVHNLFTNDGNADGSWISNSLFAIRVNAPQGGVNAEWGYSFISNTSSRSSVHGGTLLVLPSNANDLPNVPGIGTRFNTWDRAAPTNVTITGADTDNTSTSTFTVAHTGYHLMFYNSRVRDANAGGSLARHVRFHWTVDGVDPFNIRTNAKTGATKTGRGFDIGMRNTAAAGNGPNFAQFGLSYLTAGAHTVVVTGNRHESGDNAEAIQANVIMAVNVNVFSKFMSTTLSTAQTISNSTTYADTSMQPLTIQTDGTAPILLLFSTTVHQSAAVNIAAFRITRNGTVITPNGSDIGGNIYPTAKSFKNPYNVNGNIISTDNSTVPFSMMWVDNPGAGTWTYQVQARGSSGVTAFWNTNDAGQSGYVGFFGLAELKLAKSGY